MEEKREDNKTYITWEAQEYDHMPKGRWWFVVLGVLVAAIAVAAILLENYFFAAFIVIAGILISWFGVSGPQKIRFVITAQGIELGGRFHSFGEIRSFWIFYDPPLFKELSLESKKMFMPRIRVPLGEVDPARVREILIRFLAEKKHEEPIVPLISRALKF
ncbi:MAG: hypothetical protein HYW90_01875 [Candidatus Sungbacteria bacterium]|nr:hypothetical protein [Candidatus Sungbacteria bacterium]